MSRYWMYRSNKQYCVLFDGKETIAEILVERGRKGRIITGIMMWLRPSELNRLHVQDSIESVIGLTKDDARDLKAIYDGFFMVEGYIPDQSSKLKVTFLYNTNEQRQEQIRFEVDQLKRREKKRLETLIARSPEVVYEFYEEIN